MKRDIPVRRAFASLSVKDLLDAREAYHTHLLHLENVVATAIGRYRFVLGDPKDAVDASDDDESNRGRDNPRTLANSRVRVDSWPCLMVFVDRWIPPADFRQKVDEIVPQRLYLPDGRVVPTCVILAETQDERAEEVTSLRFPRSMLGGGYPSLSEVQGQTRVATIGCVVSDGDDLYVLTNRHVAGEEGRELFTLVQGHREVLGKTSGRMAGKVPFEKAYAGFSGPRTVLNLDAALVRVADAGRWTSQVYGIGQFDQFLDLNVDSVTLDLIGCAATAFGAASGLMLGEIQGLFYRYRSIGGQDQVTDLLIGPRPVDDADTYVAEAAKLGRPGNSGAVWFLDPPPASGGEKPLPRPIALHWGAQSFVGEGGRAGTQYALASSLGLICRELEVDVVRGANVGLPERWGKVGHYKVGQLACTLATEASLKALLARNTDRISFEGDITKDLVNVDGTSAFVPLADVSDVVWKSGGQSVRGREGPNHFADMDQPSDDFDGKTLLELSEKPAFLDPEEWNKFYASIGVGVAHRGLLPFRVWQLYDAMVTALGQDDLVGYVGVAGVLAHYVGDACQPLHVSMFHDGDPETGRGKGVHSAYEKTMLDSNAVALNQKVDQLVVNNHTALSKIESGHAAASAIVALMKRSITRILPTDIIDVYENKGHKTAELWKAFGDLTAERIFDGARTLAAIWQGAWKKGDGPAKFGGNAIHASKSKLAQLYLDRAWVPSVYITHMKVVNNRLVIAVE